MHHRGLADLTPGHDVLFAVSAVCPELLIEMAEGVGREYVELLFGWPKVLVQDSDNAVEGRLIEKGSH